MFKTRLLGAVIALTAAVLLSPATTWAAKAKKMSYDEAWAECKQQVAAVMPSETGQSAARYSRGAACMKQHGYRLKKSSM